MTRVISVGLVALMLSVAACRKKAPETNTTAKGAADGPAISVEGSQILVNGEIAGSTRAIEELGRLQKVDELFEKLKKDRESFKEKNPSKPFPGRAKITVHGQTPLVVLKSIFQTAAFAGYPNLALDADAEWVPVKAIIPGPAGEAGAPRVELDLGLEEASVSLIEKRGNVVTYDQRLDAPANDADFGNKLKSTIVDHVLRRDVRANPVVDVVIHGANNLPFAKLAVVLRAVRAAHERLAGPGDEDGAFVVRLAMN